MAQSEIRARFDNVRILGVPRWFPPYLDASGKQINSRLLFDAGHNLPNGSLEVIPFIAWAGYADSLAHYLSVGKTMTFKCAIRMRKMAVTDYNGNVIMQQAQGWEKDANGNQVAAGTQTPVMKVETSFVIDQPPLYGNDTDKYVNALVMAAGGKDIDYIRQNMIKPSAKLAWDGQSPQYGVCIVGKITNGTPVPHTRRTRDANGNEVVNTGGPPNPAVMGGKQPKGLIIPTCVSGNNTTVNTVVQNAGMMAAGAGQAAPNVPSVPGGETVDRTKVINGLTYDMLINSGKGWTDEKLKQHGFAGFFVQANAVPQVPPVPVAANTTDPNVYQGSVGV
jgi:hypothetical protein